MSTLKVDGIRSNSASSDAITLANDGTCTANITNRTNRNLIINGGMNVNQYGSSSTTNSGKKIFDRWHPNWNNGTITQSKETLTSGGAYDAGHRSCLRLTNTSAAGSAAGTYVEVYYKWEAQDIAKSGWNYKSASSYITLSFWLRSSVAQTYSCTIQTRDGTNYLHPFTAVISSANTWTKITKTFAGNSNLTINDDNGDGLMMWVNPMQGSNFHNSNWNTNGWFAQSGSSMFAGTTDTTWGTTAGATWDITGFQLEVGDHATDFEHRTYGQELLLCQRYFQKLDYRCSTGNSSHRHMYRENIPFIVVMRAAPSLIGSSAYQSDSGDAVTYTSGDYSTTTTGLTLKEATTNQIAVTGGSGNQYHDIRCRAKLSAEL